MIDALRSVLPALPDDAATALRGAITRAELRGGSDLTLAGDALAIASDLTHDGAELWAGRERAAAAVRAIAAAVAAHVG